MSVDPDARLLAAQEATEQGRYPEALADFLWFHQHALEYDDALSGVRLSFALMYWLQLAELYPPAKEAMQQVREQAERDVLDQSRTDEERSDAFVDVQALNEQLGVESSTVDLYRTLIEQAPEIADLCASTAFDAVAASGDVALARQCLGDPEAEVRRYSELLSIVAADPQMQDTIRSVVGLYLTLAERTIGVLMAAGEPAEATRIRRLAVDLSPASLRSRVETALSAG
jgi:tetratricopeptide (TPR) repeat protein